jgi:hypothetical protein
MQHNNSGKGRKKNGGERRTGMKNSIVEKVKTSVFLC